MDAITQLKENAKKTWSGFGSLEAVTGSVAPRLVDFSGIRAGNEVLDVACGTGVVSLTAARIGAKVTGLDLTPELVEGARANAKLMRVEATFLEGDVEALPFGDAEFDVVVSQFGHMFAPRPAIAITEMLRVLRPGGTIAFSTWPPELCWGRMAALGAKYGPPAPEGSASPIEWGIPDVVRERLGAKVKDLSFTREVLRMQALSVQHLRRSSEHVGPTQRLVAMLEASDPAKLAAYRAEAEAIASIYFKDNHLEQGFLITRATKI